MITISALPWDGLQGRPQHFMRLAIRSGWRVLYVEPPVTWAAPLRDPSRLDGWRRWWGGTRLMEANLAVLAPAPTLPLGNCLRAVNRLNYRLLGFNLRRALGGLNWSGPIDLYSFLPGAVDLLGQLPFDRVIYDCVDDHAAFPGLVYPALVETMERQLIARAHTCLATASALWHSASTACHDPQLVPNGCDFAHFGGCGRLPRPPELRALPGPVAGYVGGLGAWIDHDLVAQVARARPDWTLVFIGPIRSRPRAWRGLANLRLFGPRPYQELPAYLQHFDACLIPFRDNRLTRAVNPIKFYEYLACGRPIISTPLPELKPYAEIVDLAGDAQQFGAALDRCLQDRPDRAEHRRLIAQNSSWQTRWAQVLERLDRPTAC